MTAKEYAKKNGFQTAKKLKPWRGFACWEAIYSESSGPDDTSFIGLPQIILEKNGKIRFAEYEEAIAYIREVT